MTDDLEVLAPSGASVTFRGEMVEVLPMTIGALPKIVREARPLLDSIMDQPEDANEIELVMGLLGEHGESAIVAVALCVNKPTAHIAAGDVAEFFELAKAVYEVNRDFFTRRLAPLLANLRGAASPSAGVGPTASSS